MSAVDATARHLRLLTETIAAVNSSLDLQEVLELVASKVADALGTDACFVYLYDERADELVLRATHGTRVDELTRTPRMRPGEGITGVAAAEREPVMIAEQAHLDPRFKGFPNLPEDEYESILAVPIVTRADELEGALNVRTRAPRAFTEEEIELLVAIAAQVAQSIEHAKLYERAQRRVAELEALARISEAVSESLYLGEPLGAIGGAPMGGRPAAGGARGGGGGPRWSRSTRREPRSFSRTGRSRGPRGAPAPMPSACRSAGSDGRSASSSAIATRPSRRTRRRSSRPSPITQRSRSSTDVP